MYTLVSYVAVYDKDFELKLIGKCSYFIVIRILFGKMLNTKAALRFL